MRIDPEGGLIYGVARYGLLFAIGIAMIGDDTAADPRTMLRGVGSCSASNCHGASSPRTRSHVLQNEFVTWYKQDRHAEAFNLLLNDDSKKIAKNLGLEAPSRAKECLVCHSTWAETGAEGGDRFRVEDGVGCESCHGAADGWLAKHTEANATHAGNVSAGLTDLSDLSVRASVCSSCHIQSPHSPISHRLYGAGHPRLTFELDTFQSVMPPHWLVDEDYVSRKGPYDPIRAWLEGQIAATESFLAGARTLLEQSLSPWPEFSLYTCSSCHHSLETKEFRSRSYGSTPGLPSLNLGTVMIIEAALSTFSPQHARLLGDARKAAHDEQRLSQESLTRLSAALREVRGAIPQDLKAFAGSIVTSTLSLAADQPGVSFELAEQIAMACAALASADTGKARQLRSGIQDLYQALATPALYDPGVFAKAALRLKSLPDQGLKP